MDHGFVMILLLWLLPITNICICGGVKIHKSERGHVPAIGNAKEEKNSQRGILKPQLNKLQKGSGIKKENKFLHFENKKKVSINPLFSSLCKSVSVSDTCLHNIHKFFSEVNGGTQNGKSKERKQFCGILYGTHEKEKKMVKVENVFFCLNRSENCYDTDYLLDSEEREKADKLAKLLNLEIVGFIYAYPDIGNDDIEKPTPNKSGKDTKNEKKKNKKVSTINDEDHEFFIPMGGKEVLLALMLMKQVGEQPLKKENKDYVNGTQHVGVDKDRDKNSIVSDGSMSNEETRKKNKKRKHIHPNMKPFITLSVGMNRRKDSIIVEAYEMNYDLVKLINYNLIKDMKKQNSILQFAKKPDEKEKKIKKFDSEIDIMNELYLKCKNNVLIKKVEIKKIDIIFCVNNVPIYSHKSTYNSVFPYPLNNYCNIFQKFNYMIKSVEKEKDIVPIFRDFNFLLFLTNFFSIDHDIPHFCKAVNDLTNSINIPEHYISILKSLSNNTDLL